MIDDLLNLFRPIEKLVDAYDKKNYLLLGVLGVVLLILCLIGYMVYISFK